MARGAFMKRPGQNVQATPVNAPFGGSQGLRPASQPAPNAATIGTPAPAPAPVPAPQVPVTPAPKPQPAPKPAPAPKPPPAPSGGGGTSSGGSGSIGLIWALGGGLIVVNLFTGSNSASLFPNLWNKPDKLTATLPQTNFFPVLGEIIFLVILAILARFSDTARQLVLTFLIGLWLLWLMFKFPAVYKAGWAGIAGQLFSQGTVSSPSTTSTGTSQPASQPAFGQPYAISVPRQGGSPVGYVPHQVSILG